MEFIFYGGHWGVRDLLPARPFALQISKTYSEEPETITKLAEGLKASSTSSYLLAWLIQGNFDHSSNYLPATNEENVEIVSNLLYSFRNMDFTTIFEVLVMQDDLVVSALSHLIQRIRARTPESFDKFETLRIERILEKRGKRFEKTESEEFVDEWNQQLAREVGLI